jgi:hypothetical protein
VSFGPVGNRLLRDLVEILLFRAYNPHNARFFIII